MRMEWLRRDARMHAIALGGRARQGDARRFPAVRVLTARKARLGNCDQRQSILGPRSSPRDCDIRPRIDPVGGTGYQGRLYETAAAGNRSSARFPRGQWPARGHFSKAAL